MKSKIAILTQYLEFNYGGIIQNYALQKTLNDLGHQTITIDRRKAIHNPNPKYKVLANKYKTALLRHILKKNVPSYLDYKKVSKHNLRFVIQHIKISPRLESTAALIEYFKKEKFDGVVVGSDQVWRPKYSPNIFNFYLDFLEEKSDLKKVAYAASFGTEAWEYSDIETKKCSKLIKQFDAISVREDTGVLLCETYLNQKKTEHVLDPTLLLNAEDYSKLINKPKKDVGLFTYVLDETDEKISFINNCAESLKLNTHRNQANRKPKNLDVEKLNDYIIPPIEGWLQGFRDAEFVITDSFHGTVFSIINQKPFLVLVNKERGASRFESFLKQLNLENRLIYDVKNFDSNSPLDPIDYKTLNLKLAELKVESLNFLKMHL